MSEKRKREDYPNYLKCPLTLDIFREPVIASDGHTYEKDAITEYLKSNQRSPMTRQPINENLITNRKILDVINDYYKKNQNENKKIKRQKDNTCTQLRDVYYNEEKEIVCYKDNHEPVTCQTVKITLPDGAKYDGNIVDGDMEGHGVITFPNGSKYNGEWKQDKREGNGVLTFANGSKSDENEAIFQYLH